MVRFMRGVYFNNRFKLKYILIWDVGLVINYLKLLYLFENLDIKSLILKIVLLKVLIIV